MVANREVEALTESLQQYIKTNFKLVKLQTAERSSVIGSALMTVLLLGLVGFLFILFLSLSAGFYISSRMGNAYSGFIIIAGVYLLIGLILVIYRKKLVEKPIRDVIVRKIYSNN